MNVSIDIDIFKSDLIDIDIDIDIFKKCRYIDNRYGLSIYRTPLDVALLLGSTVCCIRKVQFEALFLMVYNVLPFEAMQWDAVSAGWCIFYPPADGVILPAGHPPID